MHGYLLRYGRPVRIRTHRKRRSTCSSPPSSSPSSPPSPVPSSVAPAPTTRPTTPTTPTTPSKSAANASDGGREREPPVAVRHPGVRFFGRCGRSGDRGAGAGAVSSASTDRPAPVRGRARPAARDRPLGREARYRPPLATDGAARAPARASAGSPACRSTRRADPGADRAGSAREAGSAVRSDWRVRSDWMALSDWTGCRSSPLRAPRGRCSNYSCRVPTVQSPRGINPTRPGGGAAFPDRR